MSRHFVTLLLVSALGACGSNPVDDNYYSLVLAADDAASAQRSADATTRLTVGPVDLPEYLQRRGLAMQIGDNRIHTANHNLWAEPLDEAISKVLVRDIAAMSADVSVERDAGRWTRSGNCRLRIEFDKFHATDRSTVVSAGRYWLLAGDSETREEFAISERLYADGHAHAVSALRQSLKTLATDMSEVIRSECAPAEPGPGDGSVAESGR